MKEKSQVPSVKAVIHAVKDRRVILSQTEPPITKALSGGAISDYVFGKKLPKDEPVWGLGKADRGLGGL
jgi:hypothetical protein